jgi:D-cysteine desulfhydrase
VIDGITDPVLTAVHMVRKLHLAHTPTPLWHSDELDRLLDTEVWVKRDDMSGGAEAGNKIRKLEYLLAEALTEGADTVLTCGGEQSNHARATVLLARQLGLKPVVVLRTADGQAPNVFSGNLQLMRLANAEFRFVTPDAYAGRQLLLHQIADERRALGERVYVIPEGGSNGLGALGYVDAMVEVREQIDLHLCPPQFDSVVFACGSGGTAAGIALGIHHTEVARRADAIAVCNDKTYFEMIVAGIIADAMRLRPELSPGKLAIHDQFVGPGYALANDAQLAFLKRVASECGLVLDPVYSGKALYGLSLLEDKPRRVLFIHTGGLPGLLAQSWVHAAH